MGAHSLRLREPWRVGGTQGDICARVWLPHGGTCPGGASEPTYTYLGLGFAFIVIISKFIYCLRTHQSMVINSSIEFQSKRLPTGPHHEVGYNGRRDRAVDRPTQGLRGKD